MRLFSRLALHEHDGKRVEDVTVRVTATVPTGARVLLTDVQLQPGTYITGWTLHPSDLGVQPVEGWAWKNGILRGDQQVVIAADQPSASPTRWDFRRTSGPVQVGQFHLGPVAVLESINGGNHTATAGAGIVPHLTARSDVTVPVSVAGRTMVCVWARGSQLATSWAGNPPTPPPDSGPVTAAHSTWGQVMSEHDTWADVLSTHTDWS